MPNTKARLYRVGFALTFTAAALTVVACGGGGAGNPLPTSTPSSAPTASPTPISVPTSAPFTVVVATPLPAVTPPPAGSTPQPVPVALPTTSSGVTGQISLPITQSSAGTQAQITMTNTAPGGLPPLDIAHSNRAQLRPLDLTNINVLLYVAVAFSGGVSLSNQPNLTFTLPSNQIVSGAYYYVAFYDPTRPSVGWQLGFEGPGSVSGTTVSFNGSGGNAFSFAPWQTYVFGLYIVPAALPTPTPAPTPTATPVPTPSPTPVTINGVSLTAVGQTSTITSTVGTPGAAISSNTSVVTTSISGNNVVLTAVSAGSTNVEIGGPNGTMIVPVTVTTTTIPVQ